MTCLEVERILPEVIDQPSDDVQIRAHLETCTECAALVADLRLIAAEAAGLVEADEPPERVWVGIANQLRAEGVIRDPEAQRGPVLVPASPRRRSLWWMAPVAAAILAAGSYQLMHHQGAPGEQATSHFPVAQSAPSQPQPSQAMASGTTAQTAAASEVTAPIQTAQKQAPSRLQPKASTPSDSEADLAQNSNDQRIISPPNDDDQRFLSEVSERAPSMRSMYEKQLRTVDNELIETRAYIRQHPADSDARQHLLDIFQQKSMLYQMALDRIQ